MKIKDLFIWATYGAAITLGSLGVTKGIEIVRDPYKKALIKKRIVRIKNRLTHKD
jgi:hypothetical protein